MAMDMFLEIEGVEGESVDSSKEGAIDILAWSWGASQSGSFHQGTGGGAGKVNVQDMSITKWIDKSSTDLLLHVCNGKHYDKATLTVRKAGGDAPIEYLTIEMTKVMITSMSTGGSGGEDRLTENVTLHFAEFSVSYKTQAESGGEEGSFDTGWDIAKNTELGG
jgi:type VI secretion system secreted protein Hcp